MIILIYENELIFITCCTLIDGFFLAFLMNYISKAENFVSKITIGILFIQLGFVGIYIVVRFFECIFNPSIIPKVFFEIFVTAIFLIGFYLFFSIIFKKMFNIKISKAIKKIKRTQIWKEMVNELNYNPQCHIYICTDGIAINKQPNVIYTDYSIYDETISLGKVITTDDENKVNNNICRTDEMHFLHVNHFDASCKVIKFSQYNLSNLDEYRMKILSEAIKIIKKNNKYISYAIRKTYSIEKLESDNNGSSGSITKIGDSYTIHAPTLGTSHYKTKTVYSVIKYIAVYPKPQKTSKPKKKAKVKEKSWL